jgi:hypothetical protein
VCASCNSAGCDSCPYTFLGYNTARLGAPAEEVVPTFPCAGSSNMMYLHAQAWIDAPHLMPQPSSVRHASHRVSVLTGCLFLKEEVVVPVL